MRMISKAYDGLIHGLAAIAAASFAFMVAGIVIDVALRNLGFRPFQPTSALIEYGLMLATMAGAPWLVRTQGHVAVRALVSRLPQSPARAIDRAALIFCAVVLLLLAWRAAVVTGEMIENSAVDIRSIALPKWVLPSMLMAGFALMAIEFLRIFLKGGTYDAQNASH